MVYNALINKGFSPNIASLITKLTTFKGHLPQGTPTSPFLSNLVGIELDNALLRFCLANDITYSRFIDDLTFSSKKNFQELTTVIMTVINSYDFKISYKKTHFRSGNAEITGVWVNKNGKLLPMQKHLDKVDNPEISESSKSGIYKYIKRVQGANN